jgi:hypothetical protein
MVEIQHLLRYIKSMTRYIAHLLILLVLFTHSAVAMDVRVCHDNEQTTEHNTDFSTSNPIADTDQAFCLDAGGHCSHGQAHTAGLVSLNGLFDSKIQPFLPHLLIISTFTHRQAPPLRPPKA